MNLNEQLRKILVDYDCPVGTIHRWDAANDMLKLVEHINIPDAVLPAIRQIPLGKGMAGLAAARREPVSICNIQTDESGQAKPGARSTGMEGSLAVPMLVEGELRGVLGIAKPKAYEFTHDEKANLLKRATEIGMTV